MTKVDVGGAGERRTLTAIATAISDSVTVSIGDDTSGARSEIFFVNADVKSTSSAEKFM